MALRAVLAVLGILLLMGPRPAEGQGQASRFTWPHPLYANSPQYAPHGLPLGNPYSPYFRPYGVDRGFAYEGSGTLYRTLCVRLCDGYYFPISYATSQSGFGRDADTCHAACGGNARLFTYPNPGGAVETMLDLTGRAYSVLPNAFRYRKELVGGCSCQRQRGQEAEAASPAPSASTGWSPPAEQGAPMLEPTRDESRAVARPDPIVRW
jgi:hypothetical protein